MASNPYAQFKKPNPYAVYKTQGSGPKAPTGFAAPGAARVAPIPGSEADIGYIASKAAATSRAEQAARIAAERQIIGIQQGTPLAAANLAKAQAEATIASQKADEAKAEQAIGTMGPNSNEQGDAYLKKYVPPNMWNVVKAYARGDLGSRSGGLSTSMLPIIQHAMNYDHSASGTNFPARVKMQSDLASGAPGSAGGQLQAFERMLLHGENVLDTGLKLNNFHSGFLSSVPNRIRSTMESWNQNPTLALFNKQVGNYAPESEKAIAGGLGSAPERQSRAAAFSGSESPEAIVAGLQGDAQQAVGAMQAVNDRYKRLMGHDIVDALSPDAQRAFNKIMAGGYDPTGKPLHPAEGWTPISQAGGGAGGVGGNGGGSPLPGATPATGATKAESMPPETAAAITGMIKRGMSAQQINSVLVPAGLIGPEGLSEDTITKARQTIAGGGSIVPQFEQPTSLKDRVISSPLGVGIGSAADAGMMGFSDEAAAGIGSLTGQGNYSDLLNQYNTGKQNAFAADPRAHLLGTIAGTATGAAGLEGGLGNIASKLGTYGLERGLGTAGAKAAFGAGKALNSPIAADALYGGLYGAGEDNDNRVGGAAMGAAFGAGGGMFGRGLARGAGNAVRGVTDETVKYLTNQEIPLTVGQVLGGFAKKFENSFSSVNPQIAARYTEGMQGFNKAGFKQGLDPINATVPDIGAEGVGAAKKAVGGFYQNTLDPLAFQVDPQFGSDYTNTALRAGELPRTMARNANDTLRMRVQDNIGPDGTMTGNDFQQSLRGLRQDAASFRSDPYGADFGGVAQQGQDALRGLVQRQAPGSLVDFDAANLANRNVSVLKDAVNRARNGTRTGETDLFAPSQLSDAAAANAKRFGGTEGTPDQPFYQLTRAGQKVLPNTIPDSGTAPRMLYALGAHSALNSMMAGAGAGAGYLGGNTKEGTEAGAGSGLALGALLTLGGTKTGQRMLTKLLLDRPDFAEPLANYITRSTPRAGMMFSGIGSALNPALAPGQ